MKRITINSVLLLAMILGFFRSEVNAQCGVPPVAYPTNVSCNGGTVNVPIDLNLLGGPYKVTPYLDYNFPTMNNPWDYAYNHPGPTFTVPNLPASPTPITLYIVDLTFGCYDSVVFTISEPQVFNFLAGVSNPPDCSIDPTYTFTMSGGTAPYTISYTSDSITWTQLTTAPATNYTFTLPYGYYQFVATDANGCTSPTLPALGVGPVDQTHWYVGLCGVEDSSVEYLTAGNNSISRNVLLLRNAWGSLSDNMKLEVDFGDNSPVQSFTQTAGQSGTAIPVSHTYSGNGVYMITYKGINLTSPDTVTVVEYVNNNSDVYPGDANGDGVANNFDLLNIGIGFGATGIARPGASLSWTPQACPDWAQSFMTGLNYKHSDCDGDGVIDYPDTNAIIVNYGQSHVMRVMEQVQGGPGSPDLSIEFPSGNYTSGSPVSVPVMLGNSTVPAVDVYGIAFTVHYPSSAFDASNVQVSFGSSWLGSVGTNAVSIKKNQGGSIDVAISRNDQTNVTGYGVLCELGFITIDNVSGKMTAQTTEYLTFSNVRMIDKDGYEIGVNTIGDTVTVNSTTGVNEASAKSDLKVYPNPAKDHVIISAAESIEEIQVMNIFGQKVLNTFPSTNEARIMANDLESGLYIIKIKTGNTTETRRIEIIK